MTLDIASISLLLEITNLLPQNSVIDFKAEDDDTLLAEKR